MHYKEVKNILSANNGMNIYRGCTHGCIYCDSRSTCYQIDHDFEDVEVKINAPELLEAALKRKRSRCMIGTGSMCDPYLPIEESEQIMRRCLEHIDRHGFGISLLTKSDFVLRDIDLLKSINAKAKAVVCTTFTTYDEDLCRILEPNVATTKQRFEMLRTMHENGIHTGVWLCPILPFINDSEENIRGLLGYCFDAGVEMIMNFGIGVTLRDGDRQYFYAQVDKYFPGMKAHYIKAFGDSYQCSSPNHGKLMKIFKDECQKRGVIHEVDECFAYLNQFEDKQEKAQMSLF